MDGTAPSIGKLHAQRQTACLTANCTTQRQTAPPSGKWRVIYKSSPYLHVSYTKGSIYMRAVTGLQEGCKSLFHS